MLGDHGNILIVDSSRSLQTRNLLAFNDTTLRLLTRESHSLAEDLARASEVFTSQVELAEPDVATMTINALALQRNKRAALVYLNQRTEIMKEKIWDSAGLVGVAFPLGGEGRAHMAPIDEIFAKTYSSILFDYRNSTLPTDDDEMYERNKRAPWGPKLDRSGQPILKKRYRLFDAVDILSGGTEHLQPPRELYVNVRVIKEVGEIETKRGKLVLARGSQYYLVRDEVEALIGQGYLEVVE